MQLHQLPKLDVEGSNPFARFDLRKIDLLATQISRPRDRVEIPRFTTPKPDLRSLWLCC